MSLDYYFQEIEDMSPRIEVTEPVKYGILIKYAFSLNEISDYFRTLSKLPWLIQEIVVAGKKYMPMRETLGFADKKTSKIFSKRSSKGIEYPELFNFLQKRVQDIIRENIREIEHIPTLNYCWGNRYRNGLDKVGKHKDDERGHIKEDPIVSVSFGMYRNFDIYKENKKIERFPLGFGDIFLMMPGFQEAYFHGVPIQSKVHDPRINLTFRSINSEYWI